MPPAARPSQRALRVLGRHVRSNRCCGTFQKNSPPSCMENSNAAVAGDPNEGSGLSRRCSQWHRINPLEDWIDPAHVWDRCVSCATCGRAPCMLHHEQLSADEAQLRTMQRRWDDLTRVAQQELTLSTFRAARSLIGLVFVASHLVCCSTMTNPDLWSDRS